jgi:hypothetical protein
MESFNMAPRRVRRVAALGASLTAALAFGGGLTATFVAQAPSAAADVPPNPVSPNPVVHKSPLLPCTSRRRHRRPRSHRRSGLARRCTRSERSGRLTDA